MILTRERARKLRQMIVKASASLPDEDALEAVEMFPWWKSGKTYAVGDRVRYGDGLWRCLIGHEAQDDWTPDQAPSLWARVLIPDPEVIPEWVQPESTNPYNAGDKVRHNGKIWVSDLDGNVWEPGIYGWTEVQE